MKTIKIFFRDLKVSLRQFVTLWLIVVPVVLALVIRAATPGIADAPLSIAMLRDENPAQADYLARYLKVELFDTVEQVRARVLERDDVPAIVPDSGAGYVILTQGNEPEAIVTCVQVFLTYQQENVQEDTSAIRFHSFGRSAPPLKITLTTALVLLLTILSGMLIATNIVEEKADKTIRSIRVAPVPLRSFVVGKSLIGAANSLVCTVLCVLAAGFAEIDFGQLLLIALCTSLISFVVGFLAGLSSNDFITAMASLKIIMIPAVAPILAIELLSETWQWLFYWSPFYWAYAGVKGVLAQTIHWDRVLMDAGLVFALSLVAYFVLYPTIRKKMI